MRKIFLLAALVIPPAAVSQQQRPFGDRVVDCLVEMKVNSDSPDFSSKLNICERRVSLEVRKEDWHRCIAKEASKLDDHISPASDIAQAVSSMCEAEFDAFLDGMTLSPQLRQSARADRIQTTKEVAVKIVLMLRAEATKPPPQKLIEEAPRMQKPMPLKPAPKQKANIEA